jgi:hypothetical protein
MVKSKRLLPQRGCIALAVQDVLRLEANWPITKSCSIAMLSRHGGAHCRFGLQSLPYSSGLAVIVGNQVAQELYGYRSRDRSNGH